MAAVLDAVGWSLSFQLFQAKGDSSPRCVFHRKRADLIKELIATRQPAPLHIDEIARDSWI